MDSNTQEMWSPGMSQKKSFGVWAVGDHSYTGATVVRFIGYRLEWFEG
jgi:hypothetical protein